MADLLESIQDEDVIDVKFGANDESDEEQPDNKVIDTSKYTKVDHLDEDAPIRGQEFALFSFLSPEGIMNCNVRAVKFRGAFPTAEKAMEYCAELEHKDKYFKIFIGESGKWLDFDPPSERVEKEVTSNKKHQKIIDAQREQRMKKINELAGKHKDAMDKKDKGDKERIKENKKSGAAEKTVSSSSSDRLKEAAKEPSKDSSKEPSKETSKETSDVKTSKPAKGVGLQATRDRLRNNLANRHAQKANSSATEGDVRSVSQSGQINEPLESNKEKLTEKTKIIGEASADLETKKDVLNTAEKNIENIKRLIAKKKAEKAMAATQN